MRFTLSHGARLAAVILTALQAAPAVALPPGPESFCETYPDSPACFGTTTSCSQCHVGPPILNSYGYAVQASLYATNPSYSKESFLASLPAALHAAESEDSDGDSLANIDEILMGTMPGSELSVWQTPAIPDGLPNVHYRVGEYDAAFAFKRVATNYCGRSPTYDEMVAFKAAPDQSSRIHARLDECLESEYWKREALHRMADVRIRPVKAVGASGDIILADYEWDYRMFSYIMSGNRDARDLLLAQYHVDEGDRLVTGTIGMVPGSILGTPIRVGSGQPLEPERRAGMITTQWFFVVNTMFSVLPRTTAAQAYRAYLGQDIAKGEGIIEIAGEPRDVDQKGVRTATCAACHSTLDPLAYAFSTYRGIEIRPLAAILGGNPTGQYDDGRAPWESQGSLFGEPVSDLLDWANKAANSPMFAHNLGNIFYRQFLGHTPTPDDVPEFNAMWQALPADQYSINKMLHRFVDSDAFGVP